MVAARPSGKAKTPHNLTHTALLSSSSGSQDGITSSCVRKTFMPFSNSLHILSKGLFRYSSCGHFTLNTLVLVLAVYIMYYVPWKMSESRARSLQKMSRVWTPLKNIHFTVSHDFFRTVACFSYIYCLVFLLNIVDIWLILIITQQTKVLLLHVSPTFSDRLICIYSIHCQMYRRATTSRWTYTSKYLMNSKIYLSTSHITLKCMLQ